MKCILFSLLFLFVVCPATLSSTAGDERIWFHAKINDQPVVLALDTGAEIPILFREAAERLGLAIIEPPKDTQVKAGKVLVSLTESCTLQIGKQTMPFHFGVLTLPTYIQPGLDGLLQWSSVSHQVTHVDFSKKRILFYDELSHCPVNLSGSISIAIDTKQNLLVLEIPQKDDKTNLLFMDTGSAGGIELSKTQWAIWKKTHPDCPLTLRASYIPALGVIVQEEMWAHQFQIGPLTISEVAVCSSSGVTELMFGPDCIGTLGLHALQRTNLILDGPNAKVYFMNDPNASVVPDYPYNRLGAVFVPDSQQDQLIAHVIEGSPGHKAGIRKGDILLQIEGMDATKWKTDPRILPLSRFWSRPAGTKLDLMIGRKNERNKITATLEDIFPPQSNRSSKPKYFSFVSNV
ncbi:MAG: aspartyl protease family protein [Sedimentisphaerales bacterium]|nr:aspartyl protease family protein [Sedimentisphaerales bacterium]